MRTTPPDWVQDAVFYQIFPDRFARSGRVPAPGPLEPWEAPPTEAGFKGGDLYGIVDRLDELVDLGVTALYLNPVFASASNHRYHTYDYGTVDPLLGGTPALRALIDAAHARGIRVVLDGVFNHVGRGFWPFHHVLEAGAASPYRDWFYLDEDRLVRGRRLLAYPDACPPGPDHPGPPGAASGGARSLARYGYRAWWDLPALPKLNTDNPHVRAFLYGVAEDWLRFGADGWRLDVPEEIADPDFWHEFRRRCLAVDPEAYLVGEIWHAAPEWLVGDRFDGLMNYPLAKVVLAFAAGSRLDRRMVGFHDEYRGLEPLDGAGFAARLRDLLGWYDPAMTRAQLNLLGSHDTPRFVTFASGDRDAYRLGLLVVAALPGAPCIYYGDEVGLEGGPDPDCRRAYPRDRSRWDEALRSFVKAVLWTRREQAALRRGPDLEIAAAEGAVAILRATDAEAVVVAANAGDLPATVQLPLEPPAARRARRWEPVQLPGWAPLEGRIVESGDRGQGGAGSAAPSTGRGRGLEAAGEPVGGPVLVIDVPPRRGGILVGRA